MNQRIAFYRFSRNLNYSMMILNTIMVTLSANFYFLSDGLSI